MAWITALFFLVLCAIVIFLLVKLSAQLSGRLDQMSRSIQEANNSLSQNLGSTVEVFGNVQKQLGSLQATNQQIVDISKNISSLQELLRAPKFRGAMGETLLEDLLSQVLPQEHYATQYRFKSGDAVDAVIRVGERLVPVDAKFSLENFQKMIEAPDEALKASLRRKFIQDVKLRIDEISSKYILPAENTYDFALMYIPAENVYYEVIVKEEVFSYSASKKVIPVSPNTIYAYLQVICLGLKGMKVEENAKQILKSLSGLAMEFNKFREDFDVVGSHLNNASSKYSEAQGRAEKISERFHNIQDSKQAP
jgi:DNA recombination protein RmuC